MLKQQVVCYDFETTGLDTSSCEITQIGACVLDTYKLDFVRDSDGNPETFFAKLKVLEPEKVEAGALAITKMTIEEIQKGLDPSIAWKSFTDWVGKFGAKGSKSVWNCPASGGHNINSYDSVIANRYCVKYGPMQSGQRPEPRLFHPYFKFDTLNILPALFIGSKEPEKFNLITLREYFGFSNDSIDNAHNALADILDTSSILLKVLKLFDSLCNGLEVPCANCSQTKKHKIKFKDSFRIKE